MWFDRLFLAGVVLLLLPALLAIGYGCLLACARYAGVCHRVAPAPTVSDRIAIVIPAHNESAHIAATVRSCLETDYPASLRQIIVIADNCSDTTATEARAAGADVWERTAPDARGKGPALAWSFAQLAVTDYDACLILDADCHLATDALRKIDACLRQGHEVLQLNHRVTNPDESAISYAAAVGRVLEYDLGFAPKSPLGLAVLLVGTGMVFTRRQLETLPWNASSCAEDTEYTIELARQHRSVYFLSNAYVEWTGAATSQQLSVQRRRWASGNWNLARRHIAPLLWSGLMTPSRLQWDLAWTLATQSRPLLLGHAALTVLVFTLCHELHPSRLTRWGAALSGTLVLLWLSYGLLGIVTLGITWHRCRLALAAPYVVGRMFVVTMRGLLRRSSPRWERTPRSPTRRRKDESYD